MCSFVTVILPHAEAMKRHLEIAEKNARLEPISFDPIADRLPPGAVRCDAPGMQRGGCNCGTVVGSASQRGTDAAASRIARGRADREKLGWGAKKLEAWEAQVTAAASRPLLHSQYDREAEAWIHLVRSVLVDARAPWCGLLWYWVDDERAFAGRADDVALATVDAERLARLEQNVMLRVTSRPSGTARQGR
jgi:hypothetical protein